MKKNRWAALLTLFALLMALPGCSLARADAAEEAGQDRLIGVFLTPDYLDLFDFEAYFDDHAGQLAKGGDVSIDDTSGYQNRIYAQRIDTPRTDPEDGSTWTDVDFVFDLEGFSAFVPTYDMDGISVTGGGFGDGLGDCKVNVGTERTEIEATLYVPTSGEVLTAEELDDAQLERNAWYVNPVYQTPDGQVYLTAGQGISFSGAGMGTMTQNLTETHTVTGENGENREETVSVTIHITGVAAPISVEVLEMSDETGVVQRASYAPDEVPEVIVPNGNTDYLIVSTFGDDGSATREVVSRDSTDLTTLVPGNKVCLVTGHEVAWP